MADRIGQQLGNYRLVRLLGQGGFAEVYLGEHVYLETLAALKVLHTQLAGDEQERFRLEAKRVAHLEHPHIVRVLEFGLEGTTPFLVMSYAPGGTLRQRYPQGTRLSLPLVVFYVKQVASALQYAHDQRIIHRDVKPENMLLGSEDQVLLSDFGLALFAAHTNPYTPAHSTQPMEPPLLGTTPYLAPEQLQGKPRAASDQYALGVVVYEWLTGTRPFYGSPIEMVAQHLTVLPAPLRQHVPDLTSAVEEVVLRALAKDPELRFARVQDFAIALEEAYQSLSPRLSTPAPSHQEPASSTVSQALPSVLKLEPLWKVPTTFTSFIGRQHEVATLCALLQRPDVRELTLLGTGGIGKTRLALQVAREVRHHFPDGVCFVWLASVSDPNLVPSTMAETLGIQEIGKRSIFEQMQLLLREQHLLLILDNFEHVLAAAPLLEGLLAACPSLTVVVTSRAVLHLQAEREFPVTPLPLPDLKQLPTDQNLAHYAAVDLFVQRAQAVLPSFQLTGANARAIAEICVRLDGLPLAIELAAARVKLLPPQALLSRLSQRLQILTSGGQTLPARQQTLRNTLKWSYDLLDASEQRLFRHLSVFVGGWTLEAVEAVCFEAEDAAVLALDGVASLLDKSLLLQLEQEGEEPRLQMLMTVREYGQECLRESGEVEAIQHAHAHYYLRLAEKAEPHLKDAQQLVWLDRLEQEHENLRAALSWLLEHKEAELALRLAGALWWFWYMRGYWSEGRRWLEATLGIPSAQGPTAARAKVLWGLGILAVHRHDDSEALQRLTESVTLYRELGDERGLVSPLGVLGALMQRQGELAAGEVLTEECMALCHRLNRTWDLANLLQWLGGIASDRDDVLGFSMFLHGNLAQAAVLCQESLTFSRELGHKDGIAYTAESLGSIVLAQGDTEQAAALYSEGLRAGQQMGDNVIIGYHLMGLARVAAAQDQPQRATRLLSAVETRSEATKHLSPTERAAYEQTVAEVRARLGEQAFAAAWNQGGAMTLEQALVAPEPAPATQGAAMSLTPPEPPPAAPAATPAEKVKVTYPDGLTAREVEVLRLVASGLTDPQIAEQLVISPRTVHTHLTSIYSKLGISSRSAATRYAIEHQLA
jgi:predicted ATPase/DNA-binding NarL/FixJ family response regulator